MWELNHKEGWALKNWCFWTVVLEKTLESPLNCKEIQPVHPKGDQSWIFIGRTHAEAEAPIHWPPDAKSWLVRKDPEGRRRMGPQWTRWLDGITNSIDMSLSKLQQMVKEREACCAYSLWVAKSLAWLSDWTTTTKVYDYKMSNFKQIQPLKYPVSCGDMPVLLLNYVRTIYSQRLICIHTKWKKLGTP